MLESNNKAAVGLTWKSLSPARRHLLNAFRDLQFGRLEELLVQAGEPCRGPRTRLLRTTTFNGENGAKKDASSDDFLLKRPVLELFAYFDRIGTGVISRIDIKAGLPCLMTTEESLDIPELLEGTGMEATPTDASQWSLPRECRSAQDA